MKYDVGLLLWIASIILLIIDAEGNFQNGVACLSSSCYLCLYGKFIGVNIRYALGSFTRQCRRVVQYRIGYVYLGKRFSLKSLSELGIEKVSWS